MTVERSAEFYDVISDPARRLAHEGPFLLWLLSEAPGDRVLDVATATGAHAAFLAENGAVVTARDIDEDALIYAERHRGRAGLTFETGDMREARGGPFDLVVCMGNSLSMLPACEDVERTLAAISAQLAPGGAAFVHVVNYAALEAKGPRQKVARRGLADGEVVIVKDMVPAGPGAPVLVSFAFFRRRGDEWETSGGQSTLLNLGREYLEYAAGKAGLRVVGEYGDYDRSAWDAAGSPDLLLVMRR